MSDQLVQNAAEPETTAWLVWNDRGRLRAWVSTSKNRRQLIRLGHMVIMRVISRNRGMAVREARRFEYARLAAARTRKHRKTR